MAKDYRSFVFAFIVLLGTSVATFAQYPCTTAPCLTVNRQGWIVGEIRALAFGENSKAQIMQDLMNQGWVECAGQPVAKSVSLMPLYKTIGDTWGSGDGTSGFFLPDLRGLVLRGWNDGASQLYPPRFGGDPAAKDRIPPRLEIPPPGTKGHSGDAVGSIQEDAAQAHVHSDPGHAHTIPNYSPGYTGYAGYGNILNVTNIGTGIATSTDKANIGSAVDPRSASPIREASETRPRNVYVMYAVFTGAPVAFDETTKQIYAVKDGKPKGSSTPTDVLNPVGTEKRVDPPK